MKNQKRKGYYYIHNAKTSASLKKMAKVLTGSGPRIGIGRVIERLVAATPVEKLIQS
jgi:hypothetical protein